MKNMKKLFALCLVVVTMLAFVGCSEDTVDVDLEGTWTLSYFTDSEGTVYTTQEFAEMSGLPSDALDLSYVLGADGAAAVIVGDMEVAGTYEVDGTTVSMTFAEQTTQSEYDAETDEIISSDPTTGMKSYIVRA